MKCAQNYQLPPKEFPYPCCCHGLGGTGLEMLLFTLEAALFPVVETISPCFAVPEASTTSLVVPPEGGLKGAGPDEAPARSHGFGGGLPPTNHING